VEDFLITNSLGITTLCTTNDDFERAVRLALVNQLRQNSMPLVEDSVDRVINLLLQGQ